MKPTDGRTLVYLTGSPGVGKSSCMAELIELLGLAPMPSHKPAKAVEVHPLRDRETGEVRAEYLGKLRPTFPGTDALSMAASPAVLGYLEGGGGADLVLGEGSRLGTAKFLVTASRISGLEVVLFRLEAGEDALRDRRRSRGSHQDPRWVRGAETRARNAFEESRGAGVRSHVVDASRPAREVARAIARDAGLIESRGDTA